MKAPRPRTARGPVLPVSSLVEVVRHNFAWLEQGVADRKERSKKPPEILAKEDLLFYDRLCQNKLVLSCP